MQRSCRAGELSSGTVHAVTSAMGKYFLKYILKKINGQNMIVNSCEPSPAKYF